jgi:hypothetical protein
MPAEKHVISNVNDVIQAIEECVWDMGPRSNTTCQGHGGEMRNGMKTISRFSAIRVPREKQREGCTKPILSRKNAGKSSP